MDIFLQKITTKINELTEVRDNYLKGLSLIGESPSYANRSSVVRPISTNGTTTHVKRNVSPEAKARIAQAQKDRWAKKRANDAQATIPQVQADPAVQAEIVDAEQQLRMAVQATEETPPAVVEETPAVEQKPSKHKRAH